MLTLRKLKLFEAVARLGSYTRAANEQGVTQPAVSIQIKHLADELGLPLFDRVASSFCFRRRATRCWRPARMSSAVSATWKPTSPN